MNKKAKEILQTLQVCGIRDDQVTASLLSIVDKQGVKEYLDLLDEKAKSSVDCRVIQPNSFINGDCMEFMRTCPPNFFDLAIVDPQYGIGASKPSKKPDSVLQKNGSRLYVASNKHKQKEWDSEKMPLEYFTELKRISKNQIIWGENYYGIFAGGRIIWDKLNGESDQYGCEIAYCSLNNRTDMVYYMWSGMIQGVYCGKDLKRAMRQQGNKKLNEERIHPTQKPIKLYKYLLRTYAKHGDLILDTHVGSGSSLIACTELGYDYVGFEIDKEYYEMAKSRLGRATRKYELFEAV